MISGRRIVATTAWLMVGLWCAAGAFAADWPGFRGVNGQGVSEDKNVPTKWSASSGIAWKVDLPGPGSSSPIVVGDKVFITAYSGYAASREDVGKQEDLSRHLLCIDKKSGEVVWKVDEKAKMPEDPAQGFIIEHGYASSTPVSDGEHIFVFYGKSGLFCYDMSGNKVWQKDLGTGSGANGWGSATSPILVNDLVVMNAAAESSTLYALKKSDGEIAWKSDADPLHASWGTPVVLDMDGIQEIVISVPGEIWGMNPEDGKLKWYANGVPEQYLCTSPFTAHGVAYAMGGRRASAVAVNGGGNGDVSKKNTVWTSSFGDNVATPVMYDGRIYWLSGRGIAMCISAADGKEVFQERVPDAGGVYASPIVANGNVYAVTRRNGTFVFEAGKEFKLLSHNVIEGDGTDFNASPAVSDSRIYLRSNQALYCIGE